MFLPRLVEYAQWIQQRDETTLAPPMYERTAIRWIINLDRSGNLLGWEMTSSGRKADRGKELFAPHAMRTSKKVSPKLLADNTEYVLGIARDKSDRKHVKNCHRAFVEQVHRCAEATGNRSVAAATSFLERWEAHAAKLPEGFQAGDMVTFRVGKTLLIELKQVREYWANLTDGSKAKPEKAAVLPLQCLICGQPTPGVERLAFKIKGIPGGRTSGTAMISFNQPAFESYGLKESLNAPTCPRCGELLVKGANYLISDDSTHLTVGPMVYLFWSKQESGFSPTMILRRPDPESVRALLESALGGKRSALAVETTPFYAAALSATAARVVVRRWLETTVAQAEANLTRFFALQQLHDPNGQPGDPLGIYALAASTVRDPKKDLSARTVECLLRVAFEGGSLPVELIYQAVRRIRATPERRVTRPRAVLIKMVLLSQDVNWNGVQDMTELDPTNQSPAYLCGRLLAVLESIQRAALPGINATVGDRFFGLASTAPASVFGHLVHGAQAHLSKLRKTRPGTGDVLQQRLEEILAPITSFPATLSLQEQGLLVLGYYHQRGADRAAAVARKQAREKKEANGAPSA